MIKNQLKTLRDRIICKLGIASSNQLNELIYQNIFSTLCNRLEIAPKYYPVGSAANYSLLYLIARIVDEIDIKSVIELGIGQSTLLLDELRKKKEFSLRSFENDSFWAEEIQKNVSHKIDCRELVPFRKNGNLSLAYDFSVLGKNDRFDLVVVDGPMGTSRYSRLGMIQLLDNNLLNNFILIFDDAERKGEVQTIEFCKALLRERGVEVFEHRVMGVKTQLILATPKFKKVAFY